MFKTTQRSTIIRSLATLAAAVSVAAVAAAPASADWPNDYPKITDDGIDFGSSGWNGFGEPWNGGELHWHDEADGDVRPHLLGTLWLNNSSGVTARMRIDYYDAAHRWITKATGGAVTARDNGLHHWSVDLDPFRAPNIYHVHISTEIETSPGDFEVVGTATEDI
jgi:hypothetical protein